MSDPQPIPPPEEQVTEDETVIDLETVVSAFLAAFDTPTDNQLEQFATLLGLDYKIFEEMVFKMFGDELQGESVEEILEDEDIVEDDLDLFIVAFFTFNSAPTEEQIHTLAEMINITPEEIEERVYRMLKGIRDAGDSEDDEDELDLDHPEDEESEDDEEGEDLDESEELDDTGEEDEESDTEEDDESEDDSEEDVEDETEDESTED